MRRIVVLAALLLLLWAAPSSYAQQQSGEVVLVGEPIVNGDIISVSARFKDIDPLNLAGLGAVSFSVSEPAADLQLTRDSSLSHSVVILVSAGFGSDLNLIQSTLRAYTDSYVKNGDSVLMAVVDARGMSLTETNTPAQLADAISAIRMSSSYPNLNDIVVPAIDWLKTQPADHVPFGLLVASYLNVNEDLTTAAAFAGVGVPLHVVQAHTYRQSATTAMRVMSSKTGGLFFDNLSGLYSQGFPARASAGLKVLYDGLAATRDVFTVQYRATNTTLVTQPQVTLTVQLTLTQTVSTPYTYQRAFESPTLTFSQQTIAPIRRPSLAPTGMLFDVEAYAITTRVAFPDNVPRRIVSLQLEVTDEQTGLILQSSIEVNPQQDSGGAYRVNWVLVDFIEPGRLYSVRLKVTATDELGLTASAEQQAAVSVAALPATATPTITPTFTPSLTPTFTRTPTLAATLLPSQGGLPLVANQTPGAPPNGFGGGGGSGDGAPGGLVWFLGGLAAVFAVLSLVLLVALARARRPRATTQGDAAVVGLSLMDIPTPAPDDKQAAPLSFNRPSQIYGRLLVKRGLPAGEILITSEDFVIGRKEDSDVHYRVDKPFVTPRHCQITHKRGRFMVRDLNSKNGTYVNGERIQPDRDVIVPIGSEIAITQNVVFELWDPNTVVKVDYQGDSLRSTRVTDDSAFNTGAGSRVTGLSTAVDDYEPIDDTYSPV